MAVRKIGIDIREMAKGSTGIAVYTKNIVDYLVGHDWNNLYFLFTNSDFVLDAPDNFTVCRLASSRGIIWENLSLRPALRKYGIDVLYSPYYKLPLTVSTPVIVTVHDIGFITYPVELYCRSTWYRLAAKVNLRYSLRKAAHIIAVSQYTRQQVLDTFHVSPHRISVVYNAVPPAPASSPRDSLQLPESYILYVGNFKPHKNVQSLVKAMSILRSRIPHSLVLVGPAGRWRSELEKLRDALFLQDRVLLYDPLSTDQLHTVYSHATALVHPSLFEGFGRTPVEAQAAGCPVMSSRATSLSEVLKDSVEYIQPTNPIDIADKVTALIQDTSLQHELIRKGKKNARRFEPDTVLPAFENVLQTVLPD